MHRKWKKWMAVILSAGMTIGSVPADSVGVYLAKAAEEQDDAQIKGTEGEDYNKGEAIILYYDYEQGIKAESFSGPQIKDDKIQVADTLCFEDDNKNQVHAFSNGSSISDGRNLYVSLVKSDEYSTEELIKKLKSDSRIAYAEPNYKIKAMDMDNDPYEKYQWALNNTGQNGGTEGLDTNYDSNGIQEDADDKEKVIALVDTGMDYAHEDLKDVVWNNNTGDSDLPGEHGYDFVNNDADPMDDNGHGSHCAGIMAASAGNQSGIAGIARSKNIKIMPLKILSSDGVSSQYSSLNAYNYIYQAQQDGVNIVAVNNSWGATQEGNDSQVFQEVLNKVGEAGALSICAAGNDGKDNDQVTSVPSNYDSPYIVAVAASNEKDELAGFSNYGKNNVDLAAPGADILSTVAKDCFNPGIYEEADRNRLCSSYQNFTTGNLVQTVGAHASGETAGQGDIEYGTYESGVSNYWGTTQAAQGQSTVELTHDVYFGSDSENGKSLKWNIKGAASGETYCLYLPYTTEASASAVYDSVMLRAQGPETSSQTPLYVIDSVMTTDGSGLYDYNQYTMLGGAYVDGKGNYWTHLQGTGTSGGVSSKQQRVIVLQLEAMTAGDYTIYIDDMGISKENVDSSQFGRYDFYNGTSMATPYVTGAVAVLANAFPEDSPEQRKERMYAHVRHSSDLEGKVSTEGVLDLSGIKEATQNNENKKMSVSSVDYDKEKNQIVISGENLKDAEVSFSAWEEARLDQPQTPIEITEDRIVLSADGWTNKKFDLSVTKGDDTFKQDYIFYNQQPYIRSDDVTGFLEAGCMVSGADELYYVSTRGNVSRGTHTGEGENETLNWEDLGFSFGQELFEGEDAPVIEMETDVVKNAGKLWTVLGADGTEAETKKILVSFDKKNGWKKEADLPQTWTSLSKFTLTVYQGKLVVLGGLDMNQLQLSAKAVSYDTQTGTWSDLPDMPEGRAFAKGYQMYDELYVGLGCKSIDGDNINPGHFSFNGSEWEQSDDQNKITSYPVKKYSFKNDGQTKTINYSSTYIGYNSYGGFFLECNRFGKNDIYQPVQFGLASNTVADYTFDDQISEDDNYLAASLGDRMYVFKQTFQDTQDKTIEVFYMPISASGKIKVTDNSEEKDILEGAGNYLLGELVTIAPAAGKHFTSLLVNGQEVELSEDGTYTFYPETYQISVVAKMEENETTTEETTTEEATTEELTTEEMTTEETTTEEMTTEEMTTEEMTTEEMTTEEMTTEEATTEEMTTEETTTEEIKTEETTTEGITTEGITTEETTTLAQTETQTETQQTTTQETKAESVWIESDQGESVGSLAMFTGDTKKLSYRVYPSDAQVSEALWQSGNADVAVVDEEGNVTALNPGETDITVTVDGQTATVKVTVVAKDQPTTTIQEISDTQQETTGTWETTDVQETTDTQETTMDETRETTVAEQTTENLGVQAVWVEDENGNRLNSLSMFAGDSQNLKYVTDPENAEGKNVSWKSMNPEVAMVNGDGRLIALNAGETDIVVTVDGKTATIKVTVVEKQNPVTTEESETTTEENETTTEENETTTEESETTTEENETTTEESETTTVSWENTTDDQEETTANQETATDAQQPTTGTSNVQSVWVEDDNGKAVKSLTMFAGDTQKLSYAVNPGNAKGKRVSWKSGNSRIAAVDGEGKVLAIQAGEVNITVEVDGKSASVKVTVVEKEELVTTIPFSEITTETQNETTQEVTTELQNETTQEVTTESQNETTQEVTTESQNETTQEVTTESQNETTQPQDETTESQNETTQLQDETTESQNTTTEAETTTGVPGETTKTQQPVAGTTTSSAVNNTVFQPDSTSQDFNTYSLKTPLEKTKPEKVKNVKKSSVKKNSLRLTWKKIKGVSGYKIYQYNTKTKKFKCVKTTKKYTIVISKLKKNTVYRFKVRAYKNGSRVLYGAYSNTVKVKTKRK